MALIKLTNKYRKETLEGKLYRMLTTFRNGWKKMIKELDKTSLLVGEC